MINTELIRRVARVQRLAAYHQQRAHQLEQRTLLTACLRGHEPAETLTTETRATLVRLLHLRGWTDQQIAERTRMSTYTTARIRTRLQLTANPATEVAA